MIKRTTKGVLNPTFVSILILVIVSLCLQFVQIQNKNLYLGYDWIFHYNRFYDAAQQIKEGNFQYFISMYGFSQSGRIINAVYGPMFAYFNGLLLLICGSWFKYQLFTNFLITFFSAVSMFLLLKKNEIRTFVSILLAVTFSTLNIVQSWTFNQTLHSWSSVLLPIGLLAATRLLQEDNRWESTLFLAFAVTLSIQTHVLTSLFLVILLSIFFVVGVCTLSNKLNLIKSVVIAAIITIFMTANVWYPLIETNFENIMNPPFLNYDFDSAATQISLFKLPAHITIVVLSLFVLQFIVVLFIKTNLLNRLVTILGFFFFIASTKLFPWNEIIEKIPSISIIQLPSRFLGLAIVLIILGVGLSIEEGISKKMKVQTIVLYSLLLIIMISGISQHFIASEKRVAIWNSDSVIAKDKTTIITTEDPTVLRDSFKKTSPLITPLTLFLKPTSDYVPLKNKNLIGNLAFHPYFEYRKAIFDNKLNSKIKKTIEHKKLVFRWHNDSAKKQTLPVFVYKRTQIYLNGKLLDNKNVEKNEIGALIVDGKKGKNVLIVKYKASFLFYYLLVVAVFSWIGFTGVGIKLIKTKKDT